MAFIGDVTLERFVFFIFVLVATVIASSLISATVRKLLAARDLESGFFVLLPRLLSYAIYLGGFYYATYEIISFNITAFAAAFGLIGLLVAFSAQQTLQNIIAGFVLLVDRSVVEGEWLEVNGTLAKVLEVSLRKTTLRAIDGRVFYVPNTVLVTTNVINYSKGQYYRIALTVPIAASANSTKAREIFYNIAVENADIVPRVQPKKRSRLHAMLNHQPNLKRLEPRVWIKEINKDRTVLEGWFWITNFRDKERIISEVFHAVKEQFAKNRIKLG